MCHHSVLIGWATWYQVAASAAVFSIKLCTVMKVVPVQAYYLEMVEYKCTEVYYLEAVELSLRYY